MYSQRIGQPHMKSDTNPTLPKLIIHMHGKEKGKKKKISALSFYQVAGFQIFRALLLKHSLTKASKQGKVVGQEIYAMAMLSSSH